MSWSRPRSPVTIVVGRPLAWAAPMPGRDEAVDAVGAAVAEEEDVGRRRWRGTPPGRGSACSRRCRPVAVAWAAPSAAVQAGLGDSAHRLRRAPRPARRRRRLRCRLGGDPALRAAAVSFASAPPSRRRARSGRRAGSPPPDCVGSFQPPSGRSTICSAPLAASQARSGLLVGIVAEAEDEVGDDRAGEVLVAQQQVVGGDDGERSCGPQRSCEVGSARIGKPATRARWASGSRSSGSSWRPATITPAIASPMWAGHLVEQEGRGLEVDPRHRGQRPAVAALQRERVGRRDRALDRDRRQRLAPGQVEVDGPGPDLAARRRQRPAGDRAVVEQPVVVGLVGADFAEPAHRRRRRA